MGGDQVQHVTKRGFSLVDHREQLLLGDGAMSPVDTMSTGPSMLRDRAVAGSGNSRGGLAAELSNEGG